MQALPAATRRWVIPLIVALAFDVSLCFTDSAHAESPPPPSEAELRSPVDRGTIARAAVARNPSVRASSERARAVAIEAEGEGRLPPPELMGQVWQVPFARPYALNAQMIMIGLHQTIPAPGSLGAREESRREDAHAEEAMAADRARAVARDAERAFADYAEATERHRIHREHLGLASRVLDLAQARYTAGGAVTDVTQAEVELARVQADLVTDASLERSARVRINALLSRPPDAPLGPPAEPPPSVPAWTTETLIARARESRPELRATQAEREARRLAARAASREATWPSFTVGALYFAPTESMPEHGYGFDAAVSLPWIWGAAGRRVDAEEQYLAAATADADGAHVAIDAEVVNAEASARSAALRLQVLRDRALPASKRSFDAAWAGYEASRADALTLLAARRAVVDVEQEIVMARASLDHALADIDAAVGREVPTVPVGPLDDAALRADGGDHAH